MLLKSLKIQGLLSFKDVELEMRPLNVLVGANGSGKSNLIEIMALLQAAPRDLAEFFRRSGGIGDWLWRGPETAAETGRVEAVVEYPDGPTALRYGLTVAETGSHPQIVSEWLEAAKAGARSTNEPLRQTGAGHQDDRPPAGQSLLREGKGPSRRPERAFVARQFDAIRLYREWNMGRDGAIRQPQPADAAADFLNEDFSNLALVLNRLEGSPALSDIEEQLDRFSETHRKVEVSVHDSAAQLRIREKGLSSAVPVTRLSDGTLRFLALLSILCHPNPPPLVCIEEPELGLHPDVIYQVAKLLLAASQRTQLIVATHSADLLDLLWEDQESVVIFERYPDTGTELSRLKKEEIASFMERYELGELWLTGLIGGNRF